MSTNTGYLPRADKDRAIWLKNFSIKLAGHAENVGVLPDEVLGISNDALVAIYALEASEIAKSVASQQIGFKKLMYDGLEGGVISFPAPTPVLTQPVLVKPGIFKRVGKMVQRIKNHQNYNEAIGRDLMIIASDSATDRMTMKPEIGGGLDAHRPIIKWKKGSADSIDIYVDRKDGKGFVFLVNDSTRDYVDTHPLPTGSDTAIWSYKGIFKLKSTQVGEFSNTINITVTRQIEV